MCLDRARRADEQGIGPIFGWRHAIQPDASNQQQTARKKKASERELTGLNSCSVVRPERFELPTAWFVARYSIQLSYGRIRSGILHELN